LRFRFIVFEELYIRRIVVDRSWTFISEFVIVFRMKLYV